MACAGIKYKKHEVYLDVVEKVNCLISPQGQPLHAFVAGAIQMKCHLSGMPQCKFGINDKLVQGAKKPDAAEEGKKGKKEKKKASKTPIALDDLNFHQCVKLSKFDNNRSISFVPPDGEFDLVKYRTTTDVHLPFTITPMIQEYKGANKMNMTVNIKGDFESKYLATAVVISIPIPTTAAKVSVSSKSGKAKYKAGQNNVIWKMKTFSGGKSTSCEVSIDLLPATGKSKWNRPPIALSFEAPFACSGLQVKYLIVAENKLGYDDSTVLKWVRYLSKWPLPTLGALSPPPPSRETLPNPPHPPWIPFHLPLPQGVGVHPSYCRGRAAQRAKRPPALVLTQRMPPCSLFVPAGSAGEYEARY